ncbi:MAG: glycosyltransferase family 4 protein [Bacteroidales bacterium]|nr:glycosyltransferase family 4 protein [Bacteroidales bacterium]MDT8431306.1 glycosyltransferase family 4 protein [Bacteroidales bacterium]
MKRPKLIIVGTSWPFRGGLAAYNERLATEYQSQGYDVTIFTFTLQYPGFLFPGKTQMADWEAPAHLDIRQEINSIHPLNWIRVGNRIRKMEPDLVIIKYWLPFMGPCFGTIARRIKKRKSCHIVTILDNIIPHEKRVGDRLFTKYFIKPVDAFVAMSESVLKDTETFDTKKPRAFCPHPLFDNFGEKIEKEAAKRHLGLDPQKRYALFFGFIRDYKGLDLVLEAFGKEALKGSDITLLIAGEFYANESFYLDLVKKNGIEAQVELHTDFIPDHNVKYYFSAADVVVQPYKTATQSGISQIAYHFNKPMIVTNVGGLPEIVPDGKVGFVVEKDAGVLAQAIARFYREELEAPFSAAAEQEKKKYSWNRMVTTIKNLIEI